MQFSSEEILRLLFSEFRFPMSAAGRKRLSMWFQKWVLWWISWIHQHAQFDEQPDPRDELNRDELIYEFKQSIQIDLNPLQLLSLACVQSIDISKISLKLIYSYPCLQVIYWSFSCTDRAIYSSQS